MKKRHEQKLVILSLFLLAAFNLPLILVADSSKSIGGIPISYVYIFSLWLFSSILTFILIKKYGE